MRDRKQDFVSYLKNNQKLLPFTKWKKETNLYKLWKQRVTSSDVRYKLCNGDVEQFVRSVYNFLDNHLDTFLEQVYEKNFASKTFRDINSVKIIDPNTILGTSNNPGYFRNWCFEEITVCGGDADINLSMKTAITNTLNGRIRKTFFMPALFADIFNGKVSNNMIMTFNKSCKLASIFSPNVYRYLLRRLCTHKKNPKNILFGTASWCVPVLAADEIGYDSVDIVDVQQPVLDKCHLIKNELFAKKNLLFDDDYTLQTYCTPSEVMHTVIDKKYDHIISCPPYYDLEIYGSSTKQSTDLYKTYKDWLEGYWRETVKASKKLLNSEGVFAFIMGHHIRYQYMSRDMVEIVKQEGFTLIDEIKILPKQKPKNIDLSPIEKYEICSIFKFDTN